MHIIPEHLRRILDLARWAPSGDNTQPWRFEILGAEHVLVHGFDTREHVVYDLDGHASQLAHGALLETMAIAATAEGRRARITRRLDTPEDHLLYDVRFEVDANILADPLAQNIERRAVQRRSMSTRQLSAAQKSALEAALPPGHRVIWFEELSDRWRIARLMFDNARVRLTLPEAFAVHKAVIEWNASFSEDRIPDRALGVDPLTAHFMRWAMRSWRRVDFLNRWMLGTLLPRLQMDLMPGLRCAAHFALLADKPLATVDNYVNAGRRLQRYWLTATALNLWLQPEMTPIIFSRYCREGRRFTSRPPAAALADMLSRRLEDLLVPATPACLYFIGRIGNSTSPQTRSVRKPLDRLLVGN